MYQRHAMPRRSGVTLLEVLVAIFIMGIGLLALLTLFPLGALRMAKAIQDERCAQAAANARAIAVMKNIRGDLTPTGLLNPTDGFFNAGGGGNNADPDGPSYPVLVDPIGWRATAGLLPQQILVGGASNMARRSVSFVTAAPNAAQEALQWFTLQDDIDFENALPGAANGPPGWPRFLLPPPPMSFIRDTRYSFAFLCQRPRNADTSIVDASVVVFNKRSLAGQAGLSLPEYVYPNSAFNVGTNTIIISYGANVPPPVGPGDWVMDNTYVPSATNPNAASAHGYYYRIVGATDTGGNTLELEVEQPLRGFAANATGTAIILDGVAEVFAIGTARMP